MPKCPLSLKTERAYLHRKREFIEFHGGKHPSKLSGEDIGAYLTHLAVDRSVPAPTQNVASNPLVSTVTCSGPRCLRRPTSYARRNPSVLSQAEARRNPSGQPGVERSSQTTFLTFHPIESRPISQPGEDWSIVRACLRS